MTDRSRIIRGVSAMYLRQILVIPLGVVTNLFAAVYLLPEQYGGFVSSIFVASIALLIVDLGLGRALVRARGELSEREYASAFLFQLIVAAACAAGLYLAAPVIASFFAEPGKDAAEIGRMIRILSVLPVLQMLGTVPAVRLERALRYDLLAGLGIIWAVVERGVLIVLMVAGFGGFSFVYSRIAGLVLQTATLLAVTRWNPLRAFSMGIDNRGLKPHLTFGLKLQLELVPVNVVLGMIPGVGGRLFSSEQVGLVSWSHNLAAMIGQALPQAVGRVLVGASSRMKSAAHELSRFVERSLLVCTAVVGLTLAITAATFPEILRYLFNPKWHGAAPFFLVSVIIMAEGIIFTILDSAAVALGHVMTVVYSKWVWAVGCIGFGIPLSLQLGPPGLLWAFVLATPAAIAVLHVKLARELKISLLRSYFLPLGGCGVFGGVVYWVKPYLITDLFTLVFWDAAFFVLGCAACVVAVPEFSKEALKLIERWTSRPKEV